MILADLLAVLDAPRVTGSLEREIRDVVADTRAVREGSLFVAVYGERTDGHAFLDAAIKAGACAVVVDPRAAQKYSDMSARAGTTVIEVANTRRTLSRLAARFHGDPSLGMRVVGVTGTNGKTTVTHMVAAILQAAGIPTGRIGTLGGSFGDRRWVLENTTPPAPELQCMLAEMREGGAGAVAMEVSSHALALDRVCDVRFAIGVLTNVTRDHLDFHGTFASYSQAKRSLFDLVGTAVLNVDDALGDAWTQELRGMDQDCVAYGTSAQADIRAECIEMLARGSQFKVDGTRFTLALSGRFNVSNALAALAVARALGVSDGVSAAALEAFDGVPGRMERLDDAEVDVLIDYAHTPDALENVLRAAREMTRRAVIVVFGCGGDRDRGKRPQMGRIAGELADHVVLTSDNPRSESPEAIIEEIAAGVGDELRFTVELDRAAAIARAIVQAGRGDVVVVAGKGHEIYQIVGTSRQHFDDREAVRAGFAQRAAALARAPR